MSKDTANVSRTELSHTYLLWQEFCYNLGVVEYYYFNIVEAKLVCIIETSMYYYHERNLYYVNKLTT